jgi:hypothetical protein
MATSAHCSNPYPNGLAAQRVLAVATRVFYITQAWS